jgi:Holliday junction resolvase RusA-like endonuclease
VTNSNQVIPTTTQGVPFIRGFITGVPAVQTKPRGYQTVAPAWTAAVIAQTQNWPKVNEACAMHVTFLLPATSFPGNAPYGPDIDNLCKRFFDALKKTVFSEAPGDDSCVIALHAMKSKVPPAQETGASVEILPVSV